MFAVAVVVLSIATVFRVPIQLQLIVPVVAAASVVGFALDAISAYKAHPVYRQLRRPFFIALARCEHPLDISRRVRIIPEGESAREATLYEADSARRVDLEVEHAVWIAAFHMHIVLVSSAVLLLLGAAWGLVFDLPHVRPGGAAALAAVYAALAVVSLIAASARLRSYNAKILDLTRKRTATARQGILRSAETVITDGWDKPEMGAQAFHMCTGAHSVQTRDDGEPYVFHPVRVALTLRFDLEVDQPECLVLALLHDVLEAPVGNRPTCSQLAEAFGSELAEECELLATKRGTTRAERDASHADSIASASPRVRLVKLADRIDNVRSLVTNPDRSKSVRYLGETERHYLDLATATSPVALEKLEDAIAEARSTLRL